MVATRLQFPFWILVMRDQTPWRGVMLTPGQVASFSDHTRAGDFLMAAANPAWEVRLVTPSTLDSIAASFARQGVEGFTLDP
ncbi:MAG TPA: hypothetical protein VLM40_20290, partial [Gemmata sp.]|nr:hypothetical protein [Gemmata sp.]